MFADARYQHVEAALVPGKRVIFYTDGLTEARNAEQQEFDVQGMLASLQAHGAEPLPALLDALVCDVMDFTGATVFEDDVCLLAVGYVGDGNKTM